MFELNVAQAQRIVSVVEPTRPTVLLVGDVEHREFAEAVAWLRQHTELTISHSIDEVTEGTLSGAADQPTDGDSEQPSGWHTIMFVESRPGQLSANQVARVTRMFPLAHCVALLGSQCEGETRSGHAWPGVVRVYWHQFMGRCRSELQLGLSPTSWQLPRTASEVERTEVILQQTQRPAAGLIAVFTRSALVFDAVSAACRVAGYSTVWSSTDRHRNVQGAVGAIWDGETQGRVDFEQLGRITALLPDVPVIALMAFPRHDQVQQARVHGAHRVVSSPLLLPDLWAALRSDAS